MNAADNPDPIPGEARAEAEPSGGFTDEQSEHIEEHSPLRPPEIYEVVRREGEAELQRPTVSLWWSGIAAGLSISFSLLAQAILRRYTPEMPWRPLVSNLGYPVGFVMVVLARQQLFTENTITVVLPVMAEFTLRNLIGLARNWSLVLAANVAGTLVAALFCTFTPVIGPELRDPMIAISRITMESGWWPMFCRGIAAGYLIAAMVWLIPSAETAQFLVVYLMTYLLAIAGFKHIIVDSMQAFMLVLDGRLGLGHMVGGFFIPVLLGNIIGGTALFALIAYAQIMKEV